MSLLDYFRFGHVRGPRSIHAEVATLPPGHLLRVGGSGEPTIEPYWQPRYAPATPLPEREWVERFRATWLDTVAAQMVADVEVGAFLSGGIDSSAVVAAMTRVGDRPVRTFTIGFPDPRYDESPHAEAVAQALGTRHTTRHTTGNLAGNPTGNPAGNPIRHAIRYSADHDTAHHASNNA